MASSKIDAFMMPDDFTQGALNLYTIDKATLTDIQNYIWQDTPNFWESLTGTIQNAMDCIISLHAIPTVATNADTISSALIRIGNKYVNPNPAGLHRRISRYALMSSDGYNFKEYYATILDYAPHTSIKIFLPYSGMYDLKVSDIMEKTVYVYCLVDFLTGDLSYTITAIAAGNESIEENLYHFSGNCKANIPLTGSDYSRLFTNVISGDISTIQAGLSKNILGATVSAGSTLANAIHDINTPDVTYTNNVSMDKGWLSTQVPYFLIERPVTHVAEKYDNYIGYPSLLTLKLSDITGYTEIESIHLDGISATDTEKTELERILKGGVIF